MSTSDFANGYDLYLTAAPKVAVPISSAGFVIHQRRYAVLARYITTTAFSAELLDNQPQVLALGLVTSHPPPTCRQVAAIAVTDSA